MSGTIMDLIPARKGDDEVKLDLEILRDMLNAQIAMAGEYFCPLCGLHGDDQERIEACADRPCSFRRQDGAVDAPYQDWPALEKHIAEVEGQLTALAEGRLQRCRACGCHELDACDPPCWWVEPDLCSSCAGEETS